MRGQKGNSALVIWLLALGALVAVVVVPHDRQVTVGRRVTVAERVSLDQIDHLAWDQLLQQFVDERGVDYAAWQSDPPANKALEHYLQSLSAVDLKLPASRSAQLAYWINAYNALTTYGILREYPTSSIRNHTARWYGYNMWRDLLLVVGESAYSLDQIEHELLRTMNEPRIHFAIVCASRGCPPLRGEAYRADRLDEQLTENARQFFADPSRFQFDRAQGRIAVSPILEWFSEDFGADRPRQLQTIAPYLPSEAARRAAQQGAAAVEYLDYDWRLNEQR